MQETQETQIGSLGREVPWRRKWQPTPVFSPGESHGQKSLVFYSPSGSKELDMTEATKHTHHVYTCLFYQHEFLAKELFWSKLMNIFMTSDKLSTRKVTLFWKIHAYITRRWKFAHIPAPLTTSGVIIFCNRFCKLMKGVLFLFACLWLLVRWNISS